MKEEYFHGHFELYCDRSGCPVRTISVYVKIYDPLPTFFVCPACRKRAKVHAKLEPAQHEERERWHARCSVNVQIYEARELKRTDHKMILIPASIFTDDTLPADRKVIGRVIEKEGSIERVFEIMQDEGVENGSNL